ncbi:MAG: YmdB family metallophosphoesterase, partial [Clostridia bacterium]|nr:YmdB family metallophosphoesterase [Clostridia bacterium]
MIKLLCLGDVVGEEGVSSLEAGGRLRKLKQKYGADLVIVNGENSAKGNGMSVESAGRLYDAGADIITGGNHTFR